MSEKVLVVDREILFDGGKKYFEGFKSSGGNDFIETIKNNSYFILRKSTSKEQKKPAEEDDSKKQIIPYIVFKHGGKYFTYQRLGKSGEERLREKFSIGIGGHINPIDKSDNIIEDGMKREFLEEVDYPHDFDYKVIGYINDDSNSVGKVHFGVVFLIDADNSDIKVKENDILSGDMKSLDEVSKIKGGLENWSRIVFDYLSST
jgi:predicted NUDIX family phosphoesterase